MISLQEPDTMWQEQGRIVQIDTLLSLCFVREHFGVYVFYGIESCKPKILYIGQSKNLINRLLQHFHYPTPGDQTGSFYRSYRDYWQGKHKNTHVRPYWKKYWKLLSKSELMVMAWPIGEEANPTEMKINKIKVLENNLIHFLKPKYNRNTDNMHSNDLEKYMQNKFDELICNLQQKMNEMKS